MKIEKDEGRTAGGREGREEKERESGRGGGKEKLSLNVNLFKWKLMI